MISLNTRHAHVHAFSCLRRSWQRLGKDHWWCHQWCMTAGVWGDDLSTGEVPVDSYQQQPVLAMKTFSHSVSVLTTKASPTPMKPQPSDPSQASQITSMQHDEDLWLAHMHARKPHTSHTFVCCNGTWGLVMFKEWLWMKLKVHFGDSDHWLCGISANATCIS